MSFLNRAEAGKKLASALSAWKDKKPVVLALPRGGVPVAAEVATALDAPLDLVLVRKIGVPFQPELAMGAISDGAAPITVRNEDVIRSCGVSESDFNEIRDGELVEIERRRRTYLGDRPRVDIAGRTAIVVDDGIATGATTRAALQATRMRQPTKLVLAVPVAPTDTIEGLGKLADDVVCLEAHAFFGGISLYYSDFRQLSDDDVIRILKRHPIQREPAISSITTS